MFVSGPSAGGVRESRCTAPVLSIEQDPSDAFDQGPRLRGLGHAPGEPTRMRFGGAMNRRGPACSTVANASRPNSSYWLALRCGGTRLAQLGGAAVKPARAAVLLRAQLTVTMRAGTPAGAGARRLRRGVRGLAADRQVR